MNPLWQIDLLGELRARSEDQTLTRFRTQKAAMLLAYLALHSRRAHPREVLAEILWPGSESAAGRLNLRVELASLRRQLEPPGYPRSGWMPHGSVLVASPAAVQLNPDAIGTDVAAFEAALQQAAGTTDPPRRIETLRRAVQGYGGELLPGFYEDWVLQERLRLAELYLTALRDLAGLLLKAGDPAGAIEFARRAVAADPLSEEAHFGLIRLYAGAGRPADALRQYRELEKALRENLGDEPAAAVRQFATNLAGGTGALANGRSHDAPHLTPRAVHRCAGTAAASPPAPAGASLPLTLTRFFGREAELAHLEALLLGNGAGDELLSAGAVAPNTQFTRCAGTRTPNTRLISLTGPGGSGKTRLAIEAARKVSTAFGEAIWFVPLAHRADPALIGDALAEALHLPRSAEIDPVDQAAGVLCRRPCLLVLDNMEHLLEAGREIVQRLLAHAPALTCLVTSRQRLELDGEREIVVAPLPVPAECGEWGVASPTNTDSSDPSDPSDCSTLARCPSVRLFLDRAQAARPDFQLTPANAAAVAALCSRLEGLPLAIELAAAWVRTLTPAQMVTHLEGRAGLLMSRRRDAPPRHQSLHAAIEWSYRLLDPILQRFFSRLAAFRGSWDLVAAKSVCGEPEALSLVAALQDRSLIVAEVAGDAMRYRLLETVREYAREQLSEEEWSELAGRHTAYYVALAEEAEPQLRGARQREWAARLHVEEPNLQAALERSVGSEEGLRLAAALPPFWQWRGHLRAGREWSERMLAASRSASPDRRARAGFGAAAMAYLCGDSAGAERLLEAGLRDCPLLSSSAAIAAAVQPLATPHLLLCHASSPVGNPRLFQALTQGRDSPRVQAFLLATEGKQAWVQGDYAAAVKLGEQSMTIYQELGDRRGVGFLLWLRGSVAIYQGDDEAARQYWEESLMVYQELDDQTGACRLTGALSYWAFRKAEYERAERLAEEALALDRRMGRRDGIAGSLWLLGRIACCRGRYDQAAALLDESLQLRRAIGAPVSIADTLIGLGLVAHARADYPRARVLLREALELRRQDTDRLDVAGALCCLGLVALADDADSEAESLLHEGLELGRRMQNDRMVGRCLRGLGLIACRHGDLARADERLRESLARLARTADQIAAAEGLEALGELRVRQERAEEATSLYATAGGIRETIGAPLPPCDQPRHTRALAALRVALGPERFAAICEEARGRDLDAARIVAQGG